MFTLRARVASTARGKVSASLAKQLERVAGSGVFHSAMDTHEAIETWCRARYHCGLAHASRGPTPFDGGASFAGLRGRPSPSPSGRSGAGPSANGWRRPGAHPPAGEFRHRFTPPDGMVREVSEDGWGGRRQDPLADQGRRGRLRARGQRCHPFPSCCVWVSRGDHTGPPRHPRGAARQSVRSGWVHARLACFFILCYPALYPP